VSASRFAKPAARALLVATGLIVLAVIGRSTVAGAGASSLSGSPTVDVALSPVDPAPRVAPPASPPPPSSPAALAPTVTVDPPEAPPRAARAAAASPDDPVALNTATVDDLRRLPGVGPKRADAILALRGRLGRFRAVEDLLKVKGIGRATLRRLRPLVRLDPPTSAAGVAPRDAGPSPAPTAPPPPG
jgi:competence protein ComEA